MDRRNWVIKLGLVLVFAVGLLVNNLVQQRITIDLAVSALRISAGASIGSSVTYMERGLDENVTTLDKDWAIGAAQQLLRSSRETILGLEHADHNLYYWQQIRFSLELAVLELTDWQHAPESFSRAQETLELLTVIQSALPSVISSKDGGTLYADNPAALPDAATFAVGYIQRTSKARQER